MRIDRDRFRRGFDDILFLRPLVDLLRRHLRWSRPRS
jgi:hypothetical protein